MSYFGASLVLRSDNTRRYFGMVIIHMRAILQALRDEPVFLRITDTPRALPSVSCAAAAWTGPKNRGKREKPKCEKRPLFCGVVLPLYS